MKSVSEDSPRRYVDSLPSTPQMARYTTAPSAYTDPTVNASPPAWWGSSLAGCAGCAELGGMTAQSTVALGLVGWAVGGYVGYKYAAGASRSKAFRVLGAVGGAVLADVLLNTVGNVVGI